jgi:hypothetical protein
MKITAERQRAELALTPLSRVLIKHSPRVLLNYSSANERVKRRIVRVQRNAGGGAGRAAAAADLQSSGARAK